MRYFRIASRTWLRKKSRKSGAQKAALWRRSSSTAVPPHFRHFIVEGLARPARSVGGLRRGATRLRSSCPLSFHPGSRGRPVRWVACDEVRPGSVPHAASHSTRAREAGPFGGLLPPLMTGLSSMVSASRTTWSGVISSSPRITRTVSGRMSSSRRTSFTRRPPAISTSRRGFRRMTFIGSPRPSRLRKPGRALDVADLGEMYRVVSSLELPPLREVEIAAVGVLETELARIQRREPLDGLSAPLARGLHGCDQLADHLSG